MTKMSYLEECYREDPELLTSDGKVDLINLLLKEKDTKQTQEKVSLALAVLNQKEYYNGHGQMEVTELGLQECMSLCNELSDKCGEKENIFYLKLFPEVDGYSGSVYQAICCSDEDDKLMLGIDNITGVG